jgi:ketosteroid isomerase-like protein
MKHVTPPRMHVTRPRMLLLAPACLAALTACATVGAARSASAASAAPATATAVARAQLQAASTEVISTERAFAATMAHRNFKAFLSFLSPDAIFFSGSMVEHGPAEIAQQWAPYFQGRPAPFAWEPDHVEVLADGRLAMSTGPLLQQGQVVGRFDSIWRLEAPHTWRIVFDKGEPVCSAPSPLSSP